MAESKGNPFNLTEEEQNKNNEIAHRYLGSVEGEGEFKGGEPDYHGQLPPSPASDFESPTKNPDFLAFPPPYSTGEDGEVCKGGVLRLLPDPPAYSSLAFGGGVEDEGAAAPLEDKGLWTGEKVPCVDSKEETQGYVEEYPLGPPVYTQEPEDLNDKLGAGPPPGDNAEWTEFQSGPEVLKPPTSSSDTPGYPHLLRHDPKSADWTGTDDVALLDLDDNPGLDPVTGEPGYGYGVDLQISGGSGRPRSKKEPMDKGVMNTISDALDVNMRNVKVRRRAVKC